MSKDPYEFDEYFKKLLLKNSRKEMFMYRNRIIDELNCRGEKWPINVLEQEDYESPRLKLLQAKCSIGISCLVTIAMILDLVLNSRGNPKIATIDIIIIVLAVGFFWRGIKEYSAISKVVKSNNARNLSRKDEGDELLQSLKKEKTEALREKKAILDEALGL